MRLRRALPEPGQLDLDDLPVLLDLAGRAPAERPYVVANMVATMDGRAAIGGRSGPIGDEADRELFLALRTAVDCVLVGAGTMRVERYGRVVRDPARRARREAAGLAADPLCAIVSGRLDLPLDTSLFTDPASRVALYTAAPGPVPPQAAEVTLHRFPRAELTMSRILRSLRADHGVRSVLCEGGPTVLGGLIADGVLDELFLTVAPKLAGGGVDPAITTAPSLPEPDERRLIWLLEQRGTLFLRYA